MRATSSCCHRPRHTAVARRLTDVGLGAAPDSGRQGECEAVGHLSSVCLLLHCELSHSPSPQLHWPWAGEAHLAHLTGPARPHDETASQRRRLSERLQWQLLRACARPHIWDCGPPAPLAVVSSWRRIGQMLSGLLDGAVNTALHWPPMPPVTLSCHYPSMPLVSSAVSHVNGRPSPVG